LLLQLQYTVTVIAVTVIGREAVTAAISAARLALIVGRPSVDVSGIAGARRIRQ
jgi:hypothetical protein